MAWNIKYDPVAIGKSCAADARLICLGSLNKSLVG